jgi:hypothetical protein
MMEGRKKGEKMLMGKPLMKAVIWKINKKFWEQLIVYFPRYDTDRIENDVSNNSSIVAFVFVTAVTFLPSRCVATIRGFLPNRAVT